MDVSNTTFPVGTSQASAANASTKAEISSDFQTFLKMLTVQMENQDPLNPVDSSDYAVQLATFSGVEQQVQTNDLLRDLAAQMGTTGMAQMASWVGKDARTTGPARFDGTAVPLSLQPENSADRAELVVRDAQGAEVDRVEISPVQQDFLWSGNDAFGQQLPTGSYQFEVESFANDAAIKTTTVDTYNKITEVRNESGKMMLLLESGAMVLASDVSALRDANP